MMVFHFQIENILHGEIFIHKLFYNKENKEVIDQELKEQYKKLNQEELNKRFILLVKMEI